MRLRLFNVALALGACCSLAVLAMEYIPAIPSLAQQESAIEPSAGSALPWTPSDALQTTVTALLPLIGGTPGHNDAPASAAATPEPTPTPSAQTAQAGVRETPAPASASEAGEAASPAFTQGNTSHAASHDGKAASLLDSMNNERLDKGLGMLERNADLDGVALARARDLVANGYFDHYAPDGRSAFTELAARGLPYRLAGENLARNNYASGKTVEAAFHGLMASPGHRANILEERYAAAGVAVIQDGNMWYYVTVFTDPR